MSEPVCVEDFCGYTSPGHLPASFAGCWFPAEALTHFTGDWGDTPPLPSPTCPSEAQVWAWARRHSVMFR